MPKITDPIILARLAKSYLCASELSSADKRICLYSDQYDTVYTLVCNESKNICYIVKDWVEWNAHGTDESHYRKSDPVCPLWEMASSLRIGVKIEGKYQVFPKLADQLQRAADHRRRICSQGTKLIPMIFQGEEVQTLKHLTENSAVFCTYKDSVIKVLCMSDDKLAEQRKLYQELMHVRPSKGLMPILEWHWAPILKTGKNYVFLKLPYGDPVEELSRETIFSTARGLKTLHSLGWIHHDLKPENLYRLSGGKIIVIGDYDAAWPAGMQYQGGISGTSGYIAPEIQSRRPYGFSVDIYSWSRMVWMLRYGNLPSEVDSSNELWAKYDICGFGDILKTAGERDPAHRYASGAGLLAALEE